MADWSPPVAPRAPSPSAAASAPILAPAVSDAEWEYRVRALRRQDRFERAENAHSDRLWCLMLTLMILCGAALVVAVGAAAAVFFAQNN